MKKIEVFDQKIVVRDYYCSSSQSINIPTNSSLKLYIKITDSCLANCKFCANKSSRDFGSIDLGKLEFVISYLLDKKMLHSISVTGGEPMVNPDKLFDVLSLIYQIEPGMEIGISTNGYNLREFSQFPQVNKLESIHISRHHYDEDKNREIFLTNKVANTEDIMFLQDFLDDKKIININTMVMKDGIDSLDKIKKMLDYVGEVDVYKNGFVSLMKCNEYAKKKFINFNDIFNNLDSNFFLGHHFYSGEYCECIDGIYLTSDNKMVEFYARMVKEGSCPYTTQLVYTSDNKVTAGFGKKVLYK